MSNDELQIYAGYFSVILMIFIIISLSIILKKSWHNKDLRSRNYMFIFGIIVGAINFIFAIISVLYKLGILIE